MKGYTHFTVENSRHLLGKKFVVIKEKTPDFFHRFKIGDIITNTGHWNFKNDKTNIIQNLDPEHVELIYVLERDKEKEQYKQSRFFKPVAKNLWCVVRKGDHSFICWGDDKESVFRTRQSGRDFVKNIVGKGYKVCKITVDRSKLKTK